jgi:hypothetical protein
MTSHRDRFWKLEYVRDLTSARTKGCSPHSLQEKGDNLSVFDCVLQAYNTDICNQVKLEVPYYTTEWLSFCPFSFRKCHKFLWISEMSYILRALWFPSRTEFPIYPSILFSNILITQTRATLICRILYLCRTRSCSVIHWSSKYI